MKHAILAHFDPVRFFIHAQIWVDNISDKRREEVNQDDVDRLLDILGLTYSLTPTPRQVPVSLAMTGITVAIIGYFTSAEQKLLCSLVYEMNGRTTYDLTEDTSHLISNHGLHDRVCQTRLANADPENEKTPTFIMDPSWIHETFQKARRDPYFHASTIEKFHPLKIFQNVKFLISDEYRRQPHPECVRKALHRRGGVEIEGSIMNAGDVDLVICVHNEEEVYKLAEMEGIPISTGGWAILCDMDNKYYDITCFNVPPPPSPIMKTPMQILSPEDDGEDDEDEEDDGDDKPFEVEDILMKTVIEVMCDESNFSEDLLPTPSAVNGNAVSFFSKDDKTSKEQKYYRLF